MTPDKPIPNNAKGEKIPGPKNLSTSNNGWFSLANKIAFWGLIISAVVALLVGFKDELFGFHKENPCKSLKNRENLVSKRISNLVEERKKCQRKDSVENYYDFEIEYETAVLENIKDSLLLCEK